MKNFRISLLAVFAAVACLAFTTKQTTKGLGPNCTAQLFYIAVNVSNLTCLQINDIDQFTPAGVDDGDNIPEATEVTFDFSNNNPIGCPDATTLACALGYNPSQLEKNANGRWVPKESEIQNYQCCVRRPN